MNLRYADDAVLVADRKKKLQRLIDKLCELVRFMEWQLILKKKRLKLWLCAKKEKRMHNNVR